MSEKKFNELQKLYNNDKIGTLVQEICEYYATQDGYEDNSYQDEIEPPEIVESIYLLFCLQSREQILDELDIVQKKYPELHKTLNGMHNTLLINMDCHALEETCGKRIAEYAKDTTLSEVLSHADSFTRTSDNLCMAVDKFYSWLHTRSR
ncbi:hypothetical protein [Butyrivibrio sp. YAB3001]|uniref:hypothetical protein n=1 Tax=Butyrivibrio sp. YAB3001 TaxID=1520812 RepID=UPI0008F674C8|nr:hypothetical protein [Butyrivibrio sp. YAB3001]SFC88495.1 hypothetical protein SAMN02910398_03407 [Butyrivibrio sp. YAB3001]